MLKRTLTAALLAVVPPLVSAQSFGGLGVGAASGGPSTYFDSSLKPAPAAVDAGSGLGLLEPSQNPVNDRRYGLMNDPDSTQKSDAADDRIAAIPLALLAGGLATQLDWKRNDLRLHAGLSAAATVIGTEVLEELGMPTWKAALFSSLAVLGAGLIKEAAVDRHADPEDIKANLTGVAAGAAFQFAIRF